MTSLIRTALVASAAMATVIAGPASAQRNRDKPAAEAAPGAVDAKKLSKPVRAALQESQKLEAAGDLPGALAQVQAAEAAGLANPTDVFFVNQSKIGLGQKLKDNKLVESALTALLTNEFVPATEKVKYQRALGGLAIGRNDYQAATKIYEQLAAANPSDAQTLFDLGELYRAQKQTAPAVASFQKAIAAKMAAGEKAPEDWYKRAVQLAYDAKLPAQTREASMAWLAAYPTPANWGVMLQNFGIEARLDDAGDLDNYRLRRAVGGLSGEGDYLNYADTALRRSLPGEAKAVLDEGIAKGQLTASKPQVKEMTTGLDKRAATDKASLAGLEKEARAAANGKLALATADAYLGYDNWAKAADLYRVALTKGGIDANTANTRLGIALARQGDKAGAAAALGTVKGEPRETLAQYWLLWVNRAA